MATDKQSAEKEITVEEKLSTLYQLQTMMTEIDKIKTLRGELPLEVQDTNVGGVLLNGVKRGDIVVVTMEEKGQKTHWVKRVIGMPGDTISCVNDIVFINGKVLDETQYIDPDYRQSCVDQFGCFNKVPNADNTDVQDFEEVKLGDDEYYVMGDNRPYSKDSRYVGPVKKSQLFAKKMLVLLPISDIGVKD